MAIETKVVPEVALAVGDDVMSQFIDGDLFVLARGDGDKDFFSQERILRKVSEPWFKGTVRRGEGILFKIEDRGKYFGRFVILTTRVLASLDEQIEKLGFASVVVHLVSNPTPSFDGQERDADPVGMSFIDRGAANPPPRT